MTPFISVIMPVFNNTRYLAGAVNSVLAQTFANFELVIVDDASTDETGALAEELAQRDKRVRVIHHEKNQWIFAAVNTGIAAAKGEYFFILNSDDMLEPFALAECAGLAKRYQADIVFAKVMVYYYKDPDSRMPLRKSLMAASARDQMVVYKTQEEIKSNWIDIEENTSFTSVNLVRTAIAQKYPFRNDNYAADVMFHYEIAPELKTAVISPKPIYKYYKSIDTDANASCKYYGYEEEMFDTLCQLKMELLEHWEVNLALVPGTVLKYKYHAARNKAQAMAKSASPYTVDEALYRFFNTYLDDSFYSLARQNGEEERLDAEILETCASLLAQGQLQPGASMYFVKDLLDLLCTYGWAKGDIDKLERAVYHKNNPRKVGQFLYRRFYSRTGRAPTWRNKHDAFILVGAGVRGKRALEYFGADRVICFGDNKKAGTVFCGKPVVPLEDIPNLQNKGAVVVTLTLQNMIRYEIDRQLAALGVGKFANFTKYLALPETYKEGDVF